MTNANETNIRRENRKNAPKFILIILGCLLLGGFFGYNSHMIAPENVRAVLDRISNVLIENAWWMLILVTVCTIIDCLYLLVSARKAFSGWDGEDEATEKRIDNRLNWLVGITNAGLILNLALFSLLALNLTDLQLSRFMPGFVAFIASAIATVLFQQQAIDMTRRMNPEKAVSMYDPKFHKKWMEHCDEREVQMVGRASYVALRAFNTACPILWLALLLINMVSGGWLGVAPCLAVALLWGIISTVYVVTSAKIDK